MSKQNKNDEVVKHDLDDKELITEESESNDEREFEVGVSEKKDAKKIKEEISNMKNLINLYLKEVEDVEDDELNFKEDIAAPSNDNSDESDDEDNEDELNDIPNESENESESSGDNINGNLPETFLDIAEVINERIVDLLKQIREMNVSEAEIEHDLIDIIESLMKTEEQLNSTVEQYSPEEEAEESE